MKIKYFINLFLVLVITSCHPDMGEFVGPGHCVSSNFAIVNDFSVSRSSVDFTKESVVFSAEFNEDVNWTIKIKGVASGAVKSFSGKSRVVNQEWYGAPETQVLFLLETCEVELVIPCRESRKATIEITGLTTFEHEGYMVANFDRGGQYDNGWLYYGEGWTLAPQIVSGPLSSPQGGKYLAMEGVPVSSPWWIGGVSPNGVLDFAKSKLTTTDASKVYCNAFVSFGDCKTSSITFSFSQPVTAGGIRKKTYATYWEGWKMVSFKLSDIGIKDVTNITMFELGLGPNVQGAEAKAYIDLLIFTENAPLFKE